MFSDVHVSNISMFSLAQVNIRDSLGCIGYPPEAEWPCIGFAFNEPTLNTQDNYNCQTLRAATTVFHKYYARLLLKRFPTQE